MIMRSAFTLLGLGALGVVLAGCGGSSAPQTPPDNNARGLVLRLQPGVDASAVAREYGLTLEESDPEGNLYRFQQRNDDREDRTALSARLRRDSRFADAEPDEGVRCLERSGVTGDPIHVPFDLVETSDSRYTSLMGNYNAATVNPTSSKQVGLTVSRSAARSAAVVVAVLDTGIEASHPSLKGHVLTGYNAITPTVAPNDLADGTQNQALGHGTMVSGIITQLAPDVKILPVRVLNADGNGTVFNVVRGLRWAVAHGARVINLSFGTPVPSRTLQSAIREARQAGAVIVASAGNAGKEQRDYPASFSEVMAVAAVDSADKKATFSNYGAHITLTAPGTAIRSTYIKGTFATWSGTSFAAPFVAGAAALVCAAIPSSDAEKVAEAVRKSARSVDGLNPSYVGKLGKGVLNIPSALSKK